MDRLGKRWLSIGICFSFSLIVTLTVATSQSLIYPVNSKASIQSVVVLSPASESRQGSVSQLSSSFMDDFQSPKAGFSWVDDLFKILKRLFNLAQNDEVLRILSKFLDMSNLLTGGIVTLLIVLINLPIIFCIWLWRLTQPEIKKLSLTIYRILEQKDVCSVYRGEVSVPIKVYEGDSHSISVKIQGISEAALPGELRQVEEGDELVFFQVGEKGDSPELDQLLEITLSAGSSITTDGEKKQSRSLSSFNIGYIWICTFSVSSSQEIGLTFNLLISYGSESNSIEGKPKELKTTELGCVKRRINIAKFLSLTKNQIWQIQILLVIVNILIGIRTIPGLLNALPTISKALGG
jgi:hypothetical protein